VVRRPHSVQTCSLSESYLRRTDMFDFCPVDLVERTAYVLGFVGR
jgi:hypothetical protein